MEIGCFEIEKDECLEPDDIAEKINKELRERGIPAEAVISIMQPSGYCVTRVFYTKT